MASPSMSAVRARPRSSSPGGIGLERVEVEGGVLEGVRVLVGIGQLGVRVEAGIGHHHHPLLGVVVEAEDLVAQQLELELRDILVRSSRSPSARSETLSRSLLLRRVFLLEDPLELVAQLGAGDELGRADLGRRQAADGDDLVLDLAQDRERLLLGLPRSADAGLGAAAASDGVGRRRRRGRRGVWPTGVAIGEGQGNHRGRDHGRGRRRRSMTTAGGQTLRRILPRVPNVAVNVQVS